MYPNNHTARRVQIETLRLDMGIEHAPLPRPVFSDASNAMNDAAFHAIWPLHIRLHGCQGTIDVPGVERLVRLSQEHYLGFFEHLFFNCGLYTSTRNFPSRMICSSSTQMLNFRPTTSMCVDESHSAPVCAPYGLPKAMCTPGYFSSWRICPITSFNSILVPIANSPTRALFSSVWVYRQKSFSSWRLAECASVNRLPFTRIVSGFSRRLPNFAQSQSPTTPSITNVPLTSPGVVNTSPPGKLPHLSGLMMPLVLSQRYSGFRSAVRSVPAEVLARTCFARRTVSTTLVLMRSTFRKSARMPSSMICRLILT